MIEFTDNFLEDKIFSDLERRFCSDYVEWHYNPFVVFDNEKDSLDNHQFTCTAYRDGSPQNEHYNAILPLFDKLEVKVPLRVKINLQTVTSEIVERKFHTDMGGILGDTAYKTAIFYLNTNNGYTEFETGLKLESVANRCVIFDGNISHRGTTCTDQKTRIVLNINYI
tara:strand:+ start:1339 stop:1842 length:504 start_codon:yes stop_codon:yes gene_type:complete